MQVLPALSKSIPIQRAKMRLRILLPSSGGEDALNQFLASLKALDAVIEQQDQTKSQVYLI